MNARPQDSPKPQVFVPFRKPKSFCLKHFLFGMAAVFVATLLRSAIDPVLGEHHPFTLYFAAVAVTAWYGGFAPAIFTTVLSYFAADWFFITPRFEFNLPRTNADELLALIAFVFTCFAIAYTSHRMRIALAKTQAKQRELEHEVSQRKQAEKALTEAQTALQQHADDLEHKVRLRTMHLQETIQSLEGVCYHIAHDLRAPVRAMHGFSTILKREYSDVLDADAMAYLGNIHDSAARMELLIHGLLEYGRLGHEQFQLRAVDSDRVLQAVLARYSREIEDRAAIIEHSEKLPVVIGNEGLLDVVFSEVLTNALRFIRPGANPFIRVFSEGRNRSDIVHINLEDHGLGIPEGQLERAFWIFERLHGAAGYPGVGMGLAIAAKAAERMGGRIGVRSRVNEGSTFWIELRLPVASAIETAPAGNTRAYQRGGVTAKSSFVRNYDSPYTPD
jgi:K+-sensing histidine kinase KdpD